MRPHSRHLPFLRPLHPPSAISAADLPKFIVEGEQHYWVHVAIDRFTGDVMDEQIEVVKE